MIKLQKIHNCILPTLIAGGLLMMAPQAHAGYWEFTYRPEGQTKSVGSQFPYTTPWTDIFPANPATGMADAYNGQVYFQTFTDSEPVTSGNTTVPSSASTKGTVTIRVKWVPQIGDTTPTPKYAFLKIWGNAGADAVSYDSVATSAQFGKIEDQDDGYYNEFWDIFEANTQIDVTQNNPLIIPLLLDTNSLEATYVFPISAQGSTAQFSPAAYVRSAAGVSFYSEIKDVGVAISSNIDPSWQKWSGAVSALPVAYKDRDSTTGAILNQPNDKAVQVNGQDTPNDSSDDIWKLACLPDGSGSLNVHSAAAWKKPAVGSTGSTHDWGPENWYPNLTIFKANTIGIKTPSFNWTYSGGTLTGTHAIDNPPQDKDTFNIGSMYVNSSQYPLEYPSELLIDFNHAHINGLNLGSNRISPTTKTTTINVTVTETDPSSSPLTITANPYKVNWHAPFEKVQDRPTVRYWTLDASATPAQVPTLGSVNIPAQPAKTFNVAAGISGIASAIGVVSGPGFPVGYAAAASIAAGLAGFAGLAIETQPAQNGYAFDNDATSWDKIADDPQLHANVSHPAWLTDPDGFKKFDVVVKKFTRYDCFEYLCDEFDSNGFVGGNRVLYTHKNFVDEWVPVYTLKPGAPTTPPPANN